jgi:hypothetical protein
MKYVYFVSPVGSDPDYAAKRKVLADLEAELGITFFFPLERHSTFTFESAKIDLAGASLVIADLSLERPSCYFELGVAEAVGTKVAVIVASGTTLHQTGNASPIRTYADLGEYGNAVRQAVSSAAAP